jgi:tRNA A-37 threonylcarbamoyl transferase component Bud32
MATTGNYDPDFRRRLAEALGEGYELQNELGRGGFAFVYAALDRGLKREVAVKALRPELYDAEGVRERFRREAEAVARLRHPHIVPIYAVGEAAGIAYFIMPRIAGESLRARLEREPRLPIAEVRRVLREAAEALAAAHRAGIVHRDIKPDNVLLDGAEQRVLLTDFGIAKALDADTRGLTQTGTVVGTPQYMSPEQASGERQIDHRSDLYSLGVVGYQMLTGEVPFDGHTVAAILVKQVAEAAPTVTRRRPDCPGDLAAAIARCLAKAPEGRWASAEDLLRALTAGEAGETREVRRSGGAPLFGVADPLRRFRLLVLGCVAVVAGGVAVDVLRGAVLVVPIALLVGGFVVAAHYGRLWTAGYTWRDVVARVTPAGSVPSPVSLDSAEFGPHYAAIQAARNDRAALLGIVQRAPKAERRLIDEVIPTVDALLARTSDVARQLYGLERQMDPGPAEIEGRLAATRAEPPSPGREQRLAVLERRRSAVQGLAARRDQVAALLAAELAAIGKVRFELERAGEAGYGAALSGIRAAMDDAAARARETMTGA